MGRPRMIWKEDPVKKKIKKEAGKTSVGEPKCTILGNE